MIAARSENETMIIVVEKKFRIADMGAIGKQ